jgi:hypothetical protein
MADWSWQLLLRKPADRELGVPQVGFLGRCADGSSSKSEGLSAHTQLDDLIRVIPSDTTDPAYGFLADLMGGARA